MQLLFRYGYLKLHPISLALSDLQYGLLVLSTVLIAAGGYVINDVFDQDTDEENKPEKVIIGKYITESKAYTIYVSLTVIGVAIGFYLSNLINHPNFAVFFILIATLLYFYASTLKQMVLIGNITVALLLSFSVLLIGVFDLLPATNIYNQSDMALHFSILLDYAKFAFIINLIREIIKDLEDYQGDHAQGMRTLAIVLGKEKTAKLCFVLLLLPILYLLYYTTTNLLVYNLIYAILYMLIAVIAPLVFCLIKTWSAKEKSDFKLISSVLKWVVFFGIVSITVITLNVKHNV